MSLSSVCRTTNVLQTYCYKRVSFVGIIEWE